MFYLYLESLKVKDKQDEIFDAVSELKSLTSSMNAIVKEVGREIIKPEKFKEVIDEQFGLIISYFFEKLEPILDVDTDAVEIPISEIAHFFYKNYFSIDLYNQLFELLKQSSYSKYSQLLIEITEDFNNGLQKIHKSVKINRFSYSILKDYFEKITPLIDSEQKQDAIFDELKKVIDNSYLPF